MNDISALNSEFAQLNNIINIGELTRVVLTLNAKLRLCNNGQKVFEKIQYVYEQYRH